MKNNKIVKALFSLCAVVLCAAAVMNLFPGALAEQYHKGDAEISAAVRNLDIDWTSGRVNIAYHKGNHVVISEKTTGIITEDMRMRWRLDGDTLRIEYSQPGFHLFSIFSPQKELTVTLPEDRTLENVTIHAVSGDLNIPALRADSLTLKTTSGDIALESADIAGKTVIETISGEIRATVNAAGEFKASSVSGDIHAVISGAGKAEMNSTSGKVTVEMAALKALDIHTVSGNVTAYLPTAPGFTAKIETVSGSIQHNLPLTQNGKEFVSGDGSAAVKIHTTSGNITLNAKEN